MGGGVQSSRILPIAATIILSLVSAGFCVTTLSPQDGIKTATTTRVPQTTAFIHSTKSTVKPLTSVETTATSAAKGSPVTTKAYEASESSTALSAKVHTSTKGTEKSAPRQKLNTSSSALRGRSAAPAVARAVARARPEGPADVGCDLPLLPNASRLWRGNETHELNLPIMECSPGGAGRSQGAPDDDCPPAIVSWEGFADVHGGDVLIVRISESLLVESVDRSEHKNSTPVANGSHAEDERVHRAPLQPAVYQVTRQGHEHCDVTDGMLLDITPLDEGAGGSKLFTLYDKDLNEGTNLFIVVSENWGAQCVRLKVTMKSDNCGDTQDCYGKGVCYTNVSMEGYECQCCSGYAGPHCDDRDSCSPSPCRNNGICVDLTPPVAGANGANYHCLCPYGFTGRNCEKDPCSSSPCLNGGSCMTMAMNGSTLSHCACAAGWTGRSCEVPARVGACASSPCLQGICIERTDEDEGGEKYRCFCQPGYTGSHCEVEYNECESGPCAHGGTCTDRVAGFQCGCARGYTGATCQLKVDLCSPNPCPERRYCVDRGNTYTCECPHGYIGDECHLPASSPCDNNPCGHGGTCWSGVDSFYCSCRPGYTGRLCEEDFILESVVGSGDLGPETRGAGSVRELHMPLGLYHDRLHNVYIAAGTLGAAIAIVGVVVTACHCRVNKTYSRLLSRLARPGPREGAGGAPHHWLEDKRPSPSPAPAPFPPPSAALDTTDMYYTLDFSDNQSSPLIQ